MIVAVIQARMGSSRLPGKVLADIAGSPMLMHQIRRVAHARRIDDIVVATSDRSEDDAIADTALEAGVSIYRGSATDVLERIWAAAAMANADNVVRLTADCPMSDPDIIDQVTELHLREHNDISSNVVERTYPDGLDVEICTMQALTRARDEAVAPFDREHVTPYMYRSENGFRVGSISLEQDLSSQRWTVDFPEDLALARHVFAAFPQREDRFSMQDVLDLLAREPQLAGTNAMHAT